MLYEVITRGTTNGYRPAVFFDNLLDGGKSQTDARAFGGEKWFEDFVDDFGRNWRTVILDQDLDFESTTGTMLCDLDMEMAARSHRLTSVLEDAQEDLLQLRLISAYGSDDVGVVLRDVDAGRFEIRSHDYESAFENFRDSAKMRNNFV